MIDIRQESGLGLLAQNGVTFHCHFAFRDYAGTAPVHWGRLRVLNRIALDTDASFTLARERSVEILTLVLDGMVAARVDGLGDRLLNPGDCHVVSAGDGVAQATWKAAGAPATVLQLWFLPEEEGGELAIGLRRDVDHVGHEHCLLASGFPEDDPEEADQGRSGDPLPLKARARLLRLVLQAGEETTIPTTSDRFVYAVVVAGQMVINGQDVEARCGVAITGCETVMVRAHAASIVAICDSD